MGWTWGCLLSCAWAAQRVPLQHIPTDLTATPRHKHAHTHPFKLNLTLLPPCRCTASAPPTTSSSPPCWTTPWRSCPRGCTSGRACPSSPCWPSPPRVGAGGGGGTWGGLSGLGCLRGSVCRQSWPVARTAHTAGSSHALPCGHPPTLHPFARAHTHTDTHQQHTHTHTHSLSHILITHRQD